MRSRALALAVATAFVVLGACGKKGPPLPPLRPMPARLTDVTARAVDLSVLISIVVPVENADGTTPSVIEAVEVYAQAGTAPPAAPAPSPPSGAAQAVTPPPVATQPTVVQAARGVSAPTIATPDNLIATIKVDRPAPPPGEAGDAPQPVRVAYTHALSMVAGAVPAAMRYAVVGVGRGRRGQPSAVLEVPLGRRPAGPLGVAAAFDESAITVTWQAPGAGVSSHVDEVPEGPEPDVLVRRSASPVDGTSYTLPVTFGARRCFVVRHIVVAGRASVEGPAALPVCVTALDTFPPPAPGDLVAIAEEGAVVLSWRGVTGADFGGYVVLRAEDASETLQPLTPAPVAERAYRDTTVRPGVMYTYAVVAVDQAVPPNRSLESNRQTVTARDP